MEAIEKKRVLVFLGFAFGIAWLISLAIFLTGGLANSPIIVPELNLSLASVLMAVGLMWAPGLANLLTRAITREGKADLRLRPATNENSGRYWLLAWVLPGILTILGAVLFFGLFPRFYDPNLGVIRDLVSQSQSAGQSVSLTPWLVVAVQALQALALAPILNALFTLGEEFGWRGYLLPKLMPLGPRRAVLLSGLIWGVWHWPVIAMGHNYGLDYPGHPWLGMVMMVVFCVGSGAILGWLTIKEGSIWPAVIGHAAINGIAAIGLLAVRGTPSTLLGPTSVGLVGGTFFWLLAALLFILPSAFKPGQAKPRWVSKPIEEAGDAAKSQTRSKDGA